MAGVRNPRNRPAANDEGTLTATADLPWAILGPILLAFLLAMLLINPDVPPVDPEDSALVVYATWDESLPTKPPTSASDMQRKMLLDRAWSPLMPGHSTADVDMWVAFLPADTAQSCQIVGYPGQLRQSNLLKLDEDDRGWNRSDAKDNLNREVVGARATTLPAGTYYVNLHLFSISGEQYPLTSKVRVIINQGRANSHTFEMDVVFEKTGPREATVYRFDIDDKGNFVGGSDANITYFPIALGSRPCNNSTGYGR
jgi:hypothetical protein